MQERGTFLNGKTHRIWKLKYFITYSCSYTTDMFIKLTLVLKVTSMLVLKVTFVFKVAGLNPFKHIYVFSLIVGSLKTQTLVL